MRKVNDKQDKTKEYHKVSEANERGKVMNSRALNGKQKLLCT
jgi:hypothetical protein